MDQLERIRRVLGDFEEVRLAYAFGSVPHGRPKPSSDLDVAVLLASKEDTHVLDRMMAELETASGRTVDLVNLAQAPPLLAHEIVTSGTLLLARDEEERVRFVTRVVARYLDTAHLRKVQHQYLRERVEARGATPR
jgi:predicted nucleotidyltransferase